MKNFFLMSSESIEQKCDALMQVNAAFLALVITVITLIPVVLSIIAGSKTSFFVKSDAQTLVSGTLKKLVTAAYVYFFASLIWFVGLLFPGWAILLPLIITMGVGLILTILACAPCLNLIRSH